MTVVGADVSATMKRKLNGRVEMEQIESLLLSDDTASNGVKPEEGYSRADHIVEWHVQTDADDMAEGGLDGCGCGGCGCGS